MHTHNIHINEMGAIYICNHENKVRSRLSPQWLCCNSCTWAHDVRFMVITGIQIYIDIYIYIHIYIYILLFLLLLLLLLYIDINQRILIGQHCAAYIRIYLSIYLSIQLSIHKYIYIYTYVYIYIYIYIYYIVPFKNRKSSTFCQLL